MRKNVRKKREKGNVMNDVRREKEKKGKGM
jgi:hypothetical protein